MKRETKTHAKRIAYLHATLVEINLFRRKLDRWLATGDAARWGADSSMERTWGEVGDAASVLLSLQEGVTGELANQLARAA